METATTVDLKNLVLEYIERVGIQPASDKFGVAVNTIKNWKSGATPPSIEAAQIVLEDGGMPEAPAVEIEKRNLYILMPAYKEMSILTHDTLFKNYAKYGAEKIGRMTEINTLVEDARNALAHRFLKETKAEHAIMIDDDMVLPYGNGAELSKHYGLDIPVTFGNHHLIDRLLSHKKQLVGALYFGRCAGGKAQFAEAFEDDKVDQDAHQLVRPGLRATKWVATGALYIHRSVFEAIMAAATEKFPDIIPRTPELPWGFFKRMGNLIGEDVSFNRRASACGIQPYVDTGLICGHYGHCVYGPGNTSQRFTRSR